MVQRLNGWCTEEQYNEFCSEVLQWEARQDVQFIKIWLSISESEQERRIGIRKESPLTSWKFSPNDAIALSKYDQMSVLKERVFTTLGEWHSIDCNVKADGRLGVISKIVQLLK